VIPVARVRHYILNSGFPCSISGRRELMWGEGLKVRAGRCEVGGQCARSAVRAGCVSLSHELRIAGWRYEFAARAGGAGGV
jgi:hypothetical protein